MSESPSTGAQCVHDERRAISCKERLVYHAIQSRPFLSHTHAPQMAYLCMAKCNDNSTASSETVNACMRRCEQPLQEVNQVVQQEVGGIQVRMQFRLALYKCLPKFELVGRTLSSFVNCC